MMAYQNNFVVSIIHNGKPVREFAEGGQRTCVVPFGSEYKIRLKNKTNARAKAKVYIDGMDTLANGGYFILSPQQTLDLERFVDDFKQGKSFKFISIEQGTATGEIQDPTSPDNGVIRVEFYPEDVQAEQHKRIMKQLDEFKKAQEEKEKADKWPWNQRPQITWSSAGGTTTRGMSYNTLTNCADSGLQATLSSSVSKGLLGDIVQTSFDVATNSSAGATVEGSLSSQQFTLCLDDFSTLSATTIGLKLRGPVVETTVYTGMEVLFGNSGLITVRMNGKVFVTSNDYGVKITLSDEGLLITGKGAEIKTRDYRVVAI